MSRHSLNQQMVSDKTTEDAKIFYYNEADLAEIKGPTAAEKTVGNVVDALFNRVSKTIDPDMPGWVDLTQLIPDFHINHRLYEAMVFRENLIVSMVDEEGPSEPIPVGGLCLDIQQARGSPLKHRNVVQGQKLRKNKFLVHVSSQMDFRGNHGGSRITAWVDKNLQTLEEQRREFLYEREPDRLITEHNLYTSTSALCYYLRRDKKDCKYYSPEKAANLINEGANFVLMRYLAITLYIGTFEVATTYINGDLCRNIYECTGPESAFVNDVKLDVCKIYRTIIEECGLVHKCATVLTLQGQIIKQDWENCNYVLHVNPLAKLANVKPTGNDKLFLEKEWKYDMELLSRYLDHKTITKKIIATYMEDHAELKEMIGDYLHLVLEMKPEDVLEFTAKYFLSFDPELIPQSEYFHTEMLADAADRRESSGSISSELWKYL